MHYPGHDRNCRLIALICFLAFMAAGSRLEADTVILKSGEKFVTSKVWEEGPLVKFSMHGIIVSVPRSDIDRIVGSTVSAVNNQITPANTERAPRPTIKHPLKGPATKAVGKSTKQPIKNRTSRSVTDRPGRIDRLPFENLRWAIPPRALGPLVYLKTEKMYDGIVQYAWKDRPPAWGKIELEGLAFGFWHNRLYSITMWVYGNPRFQKLRQIVFKNYGRVKAVKEESEKYIWSGRQTDALLEFDRRLNTGIFWMRSRLLDQQAKRLYP